VYIPKSTLNYELNTDEGLYIAVSGDMKVYMPFSSGGLEDRGGFDLSVSGEYALSPILDVGASLSHIPFVPARMSRGTSFSFDYEIIDQKNLFDGFDINDSFDDPEQKDFTGAHKVVLRPLRLDFYVLYRPFRKDILTIKPNIGFTAINPSEEVYFNGALEAQLNVARIFFLTLGTGREEGYWRHKLGMAINMRVLELDFGVGLKSQRYAKSYQLSGLEASVGMKFGFRPYSDFILSMN
jgi:hypothetical protein